MELALCWAVRIGLGEDVLSSEGLVLVEDILLLEKHQTFLAKR